MVQNKWAYYNEFDANAAAWLRELIKRGLIANGEVDERDLWDVAPEDINSFTQVHLCAGVGVWSYALRKAGWEDERECWTSSFPCQPFSAAGKGAGFADERHLWPAGLHLIEQCRPLCVFGEQVASKDGLGWLDLVQADLEGAGYASRAVDFCSAGVGAPHIRQRLYWVADAARSGRGEERPDAGRLAPRSRAQGLGAGPGAGRGAGRLGDDDDEGLEGQRGRYRAESGRVGAVRPVAEAGESGRLADAAEPGRLARWGQQQQSDGRDPPRFEPGRLRDVGGLADANGGDASPERQQRGWEQRQQPEDGRVGDSGRPGPTNGLWRDADWLLCRDGKWRPVRPSAQQMVDGATASLGRLRDSSLRAAEAGVEAWAKRHQRDGTQAVRDLWDLLSSEEAGQRSDGGFDSVRETPFLLAFLRQLSDQGWQFPVGNERSSSEAARTALRVLRFDPSASYSSRERGLDGQHPGEFADPLRELSQIMAHHTAECWGLSGWENVGSFPLARGAKARVARLRGYGNAINAEAAVAWIESYLEAESERT